MFFKNTIPLVVKQISCEDMLDVMNAFRKTNARSILLNSGGGPAVALLEFGDAIIKREVCTIGSGMVGSLAVDIFLCGKKRVATPGTKFAIHEARFAREGSDGKKVTKGEAQMLAHISKYEDDSAGYRWWMSVCELLTFLDIKTAELIARQTRIPKWTAWELIQQEYCFDVADAMHYGIIHDVIHGDQVHLDHDFGVCRLWQNY